MVVIHLQAQPTVNQHETLHGQGTKGAWLEQGCRVLRYMQRVNQGCQWRAHVCISGRFLVQNLGKGWCHASCVLVYMARCICTLCHVHCEISSHGHLCCCNAMLTHPLCALHISVAPRLQTQAHPACMHMVVSEPATSEAATSEAQCMPGEARGCEELRR